MLAPPLESTMDEGVLSMVSSILMEDPVEDDTEEQNHEENDFYDFLPFSKDFLVPLRDRAFSWDVSFEQTVTDEVEEQERNSKLASASDEHDDSSNLVIKARGFPNKRNNNGQLDEDDVSSSSSSSSPSLEASDPALKKSRSGPNSRRRHRELAASGSRTPGRVRGNGTRSAAAAAGGSNNVESLINIDAETAQNTMANKSSAGAVVSASASSSVKSTNKRKTVLNAAAAATTTTTTNAKNITWSEEVQSPQRGKFAASTWEPLTTTPSSSLQTPLSGQVAEADAAASNAPAVPPPAPVKITTGKGNKSKKQQAHGTLTPAGLSYAQTSHNRLADPLSLSSLNQPVSGANPLAMSTTTAQAPHSGVSVASSSGSSSQQHIQAQNAPAAATNGPAPAATSYFYTGSTTANVAAMSSSALQPQQMGHTTTVQRQPSAATTANLSNFHSMHALADCAISAAAAGGSSLAGVGTVVLVNEMLIGVDGRVGAYTKEERRAKIDAFRERKRTRIWRKQIKYDCRKRLADTRPRVKGRFVSRKGEDGNPIDDGTPGGPEGGSNHAGSAVGQHSNSNAYHGPAMAAMTAAHKGSGGAAAAAGLCTPAMGSMTSTPAAPSRRRGPSKKAQNAAAAAAAAAARNSYGMNRPGAASNMPVINPGFNPYYSGVPSTTVAGTATSNAWMGMGAGTGPTCPTGATGSRMQPSQMQQQQQHQYQQQQQYQQQYSQQQQYPQQQVYAPIASSSTANTAPTAFSSATTGVSGSGSYEGGVISSLNLSSYKPSFPHTGGYGISVGPSYHAAASAATSAATPAAPFSTTAAASAVTAPAAAGASTNCDPAAELLSGPATDAASATNSSTSTTPVDGEGSLDDQQKL